MSFTFPTSFISLCENLRPNDAELWNGVVANDLDGVTKYLAGVHLSLAPLQKRLLAQVEGGSEFVEGFEQSAQQQMRLLEALIALRKQHSNAPEH